MPLMFLPPGPMMQTDLVRVDLDGLDARRVVAELRARRGESGVHRVQDFEARVARAVDAPPPSDSRGCREA